MSDAATQIAFVQATWHRNIVDRAREGFTDQIRTLGFAEDALEFFEVPGAFEIPLTAKRLANTGRYRAVVASALVVDGGIYRHEFVATAVIDGLMRVQLDTDVPVFSVVLTPHHFHEHDEHVGYFTEHFVKKGAEAANAVAATLDLHASLGH
ncbi:MULTISPECIES: 6,7-dimethyl-8-ribityllumazine synthase [Mycolicibacterium]|uniref:6,7-dimethyl-8-ribityllumazine synthase n=1 Tax=Mycolicibacterium wolinskyi TaxID=59750 RepID=A0A132PH38_9MYCO|nr:MULTISPECIES: 6,7-dimethyl-8-ribityllumazine synthase [Mycolicibacterium]KWX21650.1 riboflavin synthase subunit beta [Mycolicibacterium wolinskyi]MCV7285655.1 6,7-dimethyl-8-ribityllumazine synthase [Mycolicibacterium wolinskyi]MCV7291314.1 6,7-dimethyl-8-ribityllumazine synthase [Mycolicibacterium goodii]ORX15584.1 riboflavin synthase subunit beta [Mycolicibacterium wolinskyi]